MANDFFGWFWLREDAVDAGRQVVMIPSGYEKRVTVQSKRLIVTGSNGSSKECEKIYTSSKVTKKQKDEEKIIVREDPRLLKDLSPLEYRKKEGGGMEKWRWARHR